MRGNISGFDLEARRLADFDKFSIRMSSRLQTIREVRIRILEEQLGEQMAPSTPGANEGALTVSTAVLTVSPLTLSSTVSLAESQTSAT